MTRQYRYSRKGPTKRRFLPILLLVVFAFGLYSFVVLNRELPSGRVEILNNLVQAEPTDLSLQWPDQGQAAIGTLRDGLLASSHEPEEPRPIASLAKVITALAVLEKEPLAVGETGIVITLDAEDEDIYWEYVNKLGTVTAVTAGAEINQYQALQAILLPSSNNMSDTLVRRVFGSVEAYAQYANEMVKRYGLTKTHIADASGFSPGTVSTPSEMIIIGQKVLQHPALAEIVDQTEAEIPLAGVIPNYNGLLKRSDEVNGIKPGNTDEAGWCLLFSADFTDESGERSTIIGVLLGEDDPYELIDASENLLNQAKVSLRQIEIVRGGDVVGTYQTAWGENIELVAKESLWVRSLNAQSPQLGFTEQEALTSVALNEPVGLIGLKNSDNSVQVIASSDSNPPSFFWRLTHPVMPNF